MFEVLYAVADAEDDLYICSDCGNWKIEKNLSLYKPKDAERIAKKEYGIKTDEEASERKSRISTRISEKGSRW